MDCFLVKNGGAPLNFRVVGNPQPSNPKENIIWVNTDVPIPEWKFAAENPYVVESDNLYVAATSPGYIDSIGNIQSNSDWKVTDFIELPNGTQNVKIRMSSNTSESLCHAFYDASKNLLSTVYRRPNASTYAVPANAKYIRLSERLGEGVELVADYMKDVAEGAMWFPVGTSSLTEFNALRKNGIQVYPQGAKQYVGGALVSKDAKIYQNGAWANLWNGQIYTRGDEWNAVTGGIEIAYNPSQTTEYVVKGSDKINFLLPSGQSFQAAIFTKDKIDLTNFTKLCAKIENCSATNTVSPNVTFGYSSVKTIESYVGKTTKDAASGNFTLTVDLSGVQGSYYVQLAAYVQKFDVLEIWME